MFKINLFWTLTSKFFFFGENLSKLLFSTEKRNEFKIEIKFEEPIDIILRT